MNNQRDYTIAEFMTLPSEGKVYGELIDPQIELRSMTTAEEMRRLAPNDHQYENLCTIIDDCMVKGPDISSYDMCLGDYQFLLYKLRLVTYGSEYSVSVACPYCGYVNNEKINLENLYVKTYSEEIDKYNNLTLPVTKRHVKLKMITPRMLDTLKDKVREFKRRTNDDSLDAAVLYSVSSVIDTIDGKKQNEAKLEEFIRTLPMKDTNMIANYADKASAMIGVDTSIIFRCGMCNLDHKSKIPMNSEFFRPALDE